MSEPPPEVEAFIDQAIERAVFGDVVTLSVPLVFMEADARSQDWLKRREAMLDTIRDAYACLINEELRKRGIK